MDDGRAREAPPNPVQRTEILAFETATRDLVGLALRSVADRGVSLSQFRLLLTLDEIGPASSTACASALGVVGSSITRLANRLAVSGHLMRGSDPGNRSVVLLELTDSGREVVRSVTEHRRRELGRALGHLSPEVRAACAAALAQLHVPLGADADGDDLRRHLPM